MQSPQSYPSGQGPGPGPKSCPCPGYSQVGVAVGEEIPIRTTASGRPAMCWLEVKSGLAARTWIYVIFLLFAS
jgi:hypothetical protein